MRPCHSTLLLLFILPSLAFSQTQPAPLTVEAIMRDPKWIGTSPSSPQWDLDSKTLFFNWNPDKAPGDSLYYITLSDKAPVKATLSQKSDRIPVSSIVYNTERTAYTYSKDGDIYYVQVKSGITRRITQTTDAEVNPQFSLRESRIVYTQNQNLYAWDIATGEIQQLTNLKTGAATARKENSTPQEEWLKNDQLRYFEVLRTRKEKREAAEAYTKNIKRKELRSIPIEDKFLQGLSISPDGRFISYRLSKPATNVKNTIVPSYVTESGFTTDIPSRSKVGAAQGSSEFYIYDRGR